MTFTEEDIKDRKTITLKQISKLLARRKTEGYLSSKDSNILPLTKQNKNKFFQAKDCVEIAIRYCLMDDEEILNLINLLYLEDMTDFDWVNIYPISIYKLCLYYEKIAIFESLYEKEKEMDKIKGSNIITEWFSYCIIINNITVALYLLKKFVKELYYKNEAIIDSILYILNEYSESNGAVRYHHGISHLEELLYFVEIFLNGFTYGQWYYFRIILMKLAACTEFDNEEIDHYDPVTRQQIIDAYVVNKFRTHFLVYTYNPLKIVIAIVSILKKFQKRFPTLAVSTAIEDKYLKFANIMMINYQELEQVRHMLYDRMYNGKIVIDLIAEFDLHSILWGRKPLVIINQMWSGIYQNESFLNYSINFRAVRDVFLGQNKMGGFSTNYLYELKRMKSLYGVIRSKKEKQMQEPEKPVKAHYFMFKSWEKTMAIRYWIDAVFIIAVSMFLQYEIMDLTTTATSYYDILDEYFSLQTRANDTSLSSSEQAQAQADYAVIENEYLRINDLALDKLVKNYFYWLVMTAYWFRNLSQIIYAKLRHKDYSIITAEFILSWAHLFLVILVFFRHFA